MGHVRMGFLPRTGQWNAIVEQLSSFGDNVDVVSHIANDTLNAIKTTYAKMPFDESVHKAVAFLAILAFSAQSNAIADHAFETSKIMQSFAAGWFNKHAVSSPPSETEVTNFLRISFDKMREEFRREADGK